ncbi:MAG: nuclear transport factor 2 family protein [Flammeovirgaceae bacterium]|jgi:predicted SnoaL-like aldol condensation-catalyzing enzyme|nr:nuclear transport factor 2 family protein [Flammeovirgaceae bacterium]
MKKLLTITNFILLLIITNTICFAQVSNDQSRQKNIDADNILLSVFETGDVSKLDAIIARDFINHAGADKIGLDSLKTMVKGFHARMKNVKVEVVRQLADDEYVADWVRFIGENNMVIEGIEMTRYSNGKAKEHWFFPGGQPRRN